MRVSEGEKRYALLLAARDSDYVRKVYGGYYNVFVEAFGDEGDRWDLYRVVDGDFPDAADLRKYHGFVVSGSPHDAYADDLWILRLCLLLQTLHAMGKAVLGICFGHQVLCRALGGRVGKASGGWNIGIREVKMEEDLPPCKFLDGLREIPSASIVKIHRDEVLDVPSGAKVLASSDRTSVEAFCVGEHALGIQGHPEYTKDILRSLVNRLAANNIIERDFAEDVKEKTEEAEPDRKLWLKVCKSFLKER